MITGIILVTCVFVIIFIFDILFAKTTALGNILDNPYLGGFLFPHLLYVIFTLVFIVNGYIHKTPISIVELLVVIYGILHHIIIKISLMHYNSTYYNEYINDKHAFILKHKKLLNCNLEDALKKCDVDKRDI